MSAGETSDIVEHVGDAPFDVTLERLTEAIARAGLRPFAQARQAGDAGLDMPPATALIARGAARR